ncbi:MAG: FimV/HubP family polar landmark protein, partial [Thiolinea sp.]
PPVLMQPGTALAGSEAAVRAEPRSTSGVVNRPAPSSAASPTQVASAQQQQQQRAQQQAQQRARQQAQQQQRAQQQARQRANQQAQQRQSAPSGSSRTYRVRSGDTLFKVASRLQQPGVNVDQMMMALYRANPKAFIKGNINGLKAGAVLRAPSGQAAKSTSRAQARRQVRQQYAEWKKFRSTLAKKTVPQKSVAAKSTPTKTQTAQAPANNAAADKDKARLEVLGKADKAAAGKGNSAAGAERLSKLEQQLALARESMVARQRENKELKSRVNDLESMLRKKNRLIALRDDQLAQLQKQLAGGAANQAVNPNGTAVAQMNPQSGNNSATSGNLPNNNVVPRTQGETRPVGSDIQNQVANSTQAGQNKVVRAQQPENNQTQQPANNTAQQAAGVNNLNGTDADNTNKPAAVFADQQDDGNDLMDLLMSPMAWKIGAGALFSLLLLWLLSRLLGRRKSAPKKTPLVADEPVIFDADNESLEAIQEDQPFRELEAELDKAEKGGAAGLNDDPFGMGKSGDDSSYTTVSPDIVEADAEQDEDETLMEANVYIAYGLHQQAESELQKALEKHPERLEYRHKLLENYFASNNREEFDRNAEAYLATQGADRNSKMWQEIADWGKKISPDNRMYTEQSSGVGTAVAAAGAAVAGAAASAIALGSDDDATRLQAAETSDLTAGGQSNEANQSDIDQVLNGLQDDDDLGLDDFDFDLDDLENELSGELDAPATASDAVETVATESGLDFAPDSELAQTVDDGLDFSLDDLAGELQQDVNAGSNDLNLDLDAEMPAGVADLPENPLGDELDFDDLLNGNPEPLPEAAADQNDDGIGLMGGLAAGAVAAAGATAAAVMSGKDKVSDALDNAGEAVEDALNFDASLPDLNTDVADGVDNTLDFEQSLDDLPDLGELPSDETQLLEQPLAGESDLPDLETFDFDLENVNPAPAQDIAAEAQEQVEAVADEAVGAADNVTNLNLHLDKESGLKKILPQDTFYTSGDEPVAAENAEGEDSWLGDIDDALSFLDMPDEEIDLHEAHISTKLDLARAYLDMGDIEGARSTLEEVMVEGNDNQRREAETLLHQTG